MDHELVKKLRYKSGAAAILHAPEGFEPGIESVEPAAEAEGNCEFVLLFVKSLADAREYGSQAISLLKGDAVFWIAYPKTTSKLKSDVNRDTLAQQMMDTTSYRPVSNVAIDATWSALRFRPKALVN